MATDNATFHAAAEYDRGVRVSIPFYDFLHSETLDLVRHIKPDAALWLDTGCGTGTLVEKALDLFPATVFLLADPAGKMLEQARSRASLAGNSRVRFVAQAPSEDLFSLLAERPDVITAIQCHHYHGPEGRRAATKACFDLLAEGGLYVTCENVRPLTEEGTCIGLARWRSCQIARGRASVDAEKHLARFGAEYFPITVEEHLALLRDCGFRTVELFWYSMMQVGLYALK